MESLADDLGISWKPEPSGMPFHHNEEDGIVISEENTHKYNREQFELAQRPVVNEPAELEGKSASQILEMYKRGVAEQEERSKPKRQIEAVHQFIVEAPEFVLNRSNQERVDAYLQAATLDATNVDHFHQAYRALASRGLIAVDESKRLRSVGHSA